MQELPPYAVFALQRITQAELHLETGTEIVDRIGTTRVAPGINGIRSRCAGFYLFQTHAGHRVKGIGREVLRAPALVQQVGQVNDVVGKGDGMYMFTGLEIIVLAETEVQLGIPGGTATITLCKSAAARFQVFVAIDIGIEF